MTMAYIPGSENYLRPQLQPIERTHFDCTIAARFYFLDLWRYDNTPATWMRSNDAEFWRSRGFKVFPLGVLTSEYGLTDEELLKLIRSTHYDNPRYRIRGFVKHILVSGPLFYVAADDGKSLLDAIEKYITSKKVRSAAAVHRVQKKNRRLEAENKKLRDGAKQNVLKMSEELDAHLRQQIDDALDARLGPVMHALEQIHNKINLALNAKLNMVVPKQ